MQRELRGQRRRLLSLLPITVVGAIGGAALLLTTPAQAFNRVVPLLIVVACAVLLFQHRLTTLLEGARAGRAWVLRGGMLLTAVYGGYFGAAVSIVVLALLAVTVGRHDAPAQRGQGAAGGMHEPRVGHRLRVLRPGPLGIRGRAGPVHAGRRARRRGRWRGGSPQQPLRYSVIALGLVAAVWLQLSH